MKIEWPKPQFWIVGFFVLLAIRMIAVGPQIEYAWLEYLASKGGVFLLGWFVVYLLQIVVFGFMVSWMWNAYEKSKT